jgi:hypothetical protein
MLFLFIISSLFLPHPAQAEKADSYTNLQCPSESAECTLVTAKYETNEITEINWNDLLDSTVSLQKFAKVRNLSITAGDIGT